MQTIDKIIALVETAQDLLQTRGDELDATPEQEAQAEKARQFLLLAGGALEKAKKAE